MKTVLAVVGAATLIYLGLGALGLTKPLLLNGAHLQCTERTQ